jgi:DNA-binding transcriptional regulator YhcF (GntR family)
MPRSGVAPSASSESRTSKIRGRPGDGARTYIVPMVARAINITQTLQKEDVFLSVDDLRKLTGYSRTTVYRILRTLASFGYVRREVRSGQYGWCANTGRNSQRERKEFHPSW